MAKGLRRLAIQLRTQGLILVPTLSSQFKPGAVITRHTWRNMDVIGNLKRSNLGKAPPIIGPERPAKLENLNRAHELTLDSAADFSAISGGVAEAKAAAKSKHANELVMRFEGAVSRKMDLLDLEESLEGSSKFWNSAAWQTLKAPKGRLVYEVFTSKISLMFAQEGEGGVDVKADLDKIGNFSLSSGWKWRSKSTIESKTPVVIAVNYARYRPARKRLVSVVK